MLAAGIAIRQYASLPDRHTAPAHHLTFSVLFL
jgi:hypothetical protein